MTNALRFKRYPRVVRARLERAGFKVWTSIDGHLHVAERTKSDALDADDVRAELVRKANALADLIGNA